VTLSHQASAEFFAAADLVTSPSPRNGAPDFRVCKNAEAALLSLEKAGRATISDWPPVAATSEKPASVLAGGEFPILIPVTDGRVAVKWKRFGYWAEVVPRWLETGRLQLDITPEIASKDFAHAVISNGLTIPGLTTRRVCARVEMNLGETAVINLGPERGSSDDDDLTPTPGKSDRVAAGGATGHVAAEHAAKRETVTLFLVTPSGAPPALGASGAAK
jgi:pilus assembly protein CpaC